MNKSKGCRNVYFSFRVTVIQNNEKRAIRALHIVKYILSRQLLVQYGLW